MFQEPQGTKEDGRIPLSNEGREVSQIVRLIGLPRHCPLSTVPLSRNKHVFYYLGSSQLPIRDIVFGSLLRSTRPVLIVLESVPRSRVTLLDKDPLDVCIPD
jgi:hypothetical protein